MEIKIKVKNKEIATVAAKVVVFCVHFGDEVATRGNLCQIYKMGP